MLGSGASCDGMWLIP